MYLISVSALDASLFDINFTVVGANKLARREMRMHRSKRGKCGMRRWREKVERNN